MNFVSNGNAETILTKVGEKFATLEGAYTIRGSRTFANLPTTLTETMNGYVYNVTDDFTTTELFAEGAGIEQKAGTNVVVVDRSTYAEATPAGSENPSTEGWYELVDERYKKSIDTEVDSEKTYYIKTVSMKYDVNGSFVNVKPLQDEITATKGMISDAFSPDTNYSAGAIVIYENGLYQFDSAYTAYTAVTPVGTENPSEEGWYETDGSAYTETSDSTVDSEKTYYQQNEWDSSLVTPVTIAELIQSAEPDSLTTPQINSLLALLD